MIQTWEAESLEEIKTTGRTHPIVLNCERLNQDGDTIEKGPFLVKALGLSQEVIPSTLYREVVGNHIAYSLGVVTPGVVLVNLPTDFCSGLNVALRPYNLSITPCL